MPCAAVISVPRNCPHTQVYFFEVCQHSVTGVLRAFEPPYHHEMSWERCQRKQCAAEQRAVLLFCSSVIDVKGNSARQQSAVLCCAVRLLFLRVQSYSERKPHALRAITTTHTAMLPHERTLPRTHPRRERERERERDRESQHHEAHVRMNAC